MNTLQTRHGGFRTSMLLCAVLMLFNSCDICYRATIDTKASELFEVSEGSIEISAMYFKEAMISLKCDGVFQVIPSKCLTMGIGANFNYDNVIYCKTNSSASQDDSKESLVLIEQPLTIENSTIVIKVFCPEPDILRKRNSPFLVDLSSFILCHGEQVFKEPILINLMYK